MNQPNLFDLLIVVLFLGSILSACQRGLAREMLHTVLFAIAAFVGYWFMRGEAASLPSGQQLSATEVGAIFVNLGYYLLSIYVLTWAMMRFGAPLLLDSHIPGFRSRFWGGMLAMTKLVVTALALNLWLAVNSPDAHPLRLQSLPTLLQTSTLVQLSDSTTEELYKYLAQHGFLNYHKYLERELTPEEQANRRTQKLLGLQTNSPTVSDPYEGQR